MRRFAALGELAVPPAADHRKARGARLTSTENELGEDDKWIG
jgi:hypothetical protein